MPDSAQLLKPTIHCVEQFVAAACAVAATQPSNRIKSEIEQLVRSALDTIELDSFEDVEVNRRGYARKVLFSHPEGLFSILQLKWAPGAITPIHGHNAWGVVGVVDGTIGCETFVHQRHNASHRPAVSDATTAPLLSRGTIRASKGAVATVNPDPEGIHRLYNPTSADAMTLHVYGMDLSTSPCAINVAYEQPGNRHT